MKTKLDFMEISRDLEIHHSVFYQLWQMGRPIFTESIKTACVTFDRDGNHIGFMWNPKFYDKLTKYERKFVICHECLHIIFNHGHRAKGMKFQDLANVAMDVVINEMLVDRFGFERDKISNSEDLCWLDTVFKGRADVEPDQTFEYYYKILSKDAKIIKIPLMLVDDHIGLGGCDWSEVIDQLNEDLTPEEKESLKEAIEKHFQEGDKEAQATGRGTETGGVWTFANIPEYVVKKKKWETVIKKWSMKFTSDFRNQEQWARMHRRFTLLPDNLLLPSEMEVEDLSKPGKIEVWFFQDTSGSCAHLKDRFFTAAASLPPWRFDVKMHCFDTQVFETSLESGKLYGFGGTSFDILEAYIQKYCAEQKKPYPEAVFVITDGMGNKVFPQHPERWYWFLSDDYRYCIPEKCNIFKLSDFE